MPFSVRKSLVAAAMCALLTAPSALAAGRRTLQEDPLTRIDHLENEVVANMEAIDEIEKELGIGPYAVNYGPLGSSNEKKVNLKIYGCYKIQTKNGKEEFPSDNNDCPHEIEDFVEAGSKSPDLKKYPWAHVSVLNAGGSCNNTPAKKGEQSQCDKYFETLKRFKKGDKDHGWYPYVKADSTISPKESDAAMYEVHLKGDGKEDKTIMDLIGALNQLKLKDASNCGPNCQSDKTPCPDACAGRSSIGYHITVPPKWIGDKGKTDMKLDPTPVAILNGKKEKEIGKTNYIMKWYIGDKDNNIVYHLKDTSK
mmetsp:Transcript_9405/g.23404  ORF Transcript_9405/g.23404 Transcript_9405/m.23404 type:complete len:310 (-) Transcript_9405:837-1766(-)